MSLKVTFVAVGVSIVGFGVASPAGAGSSPLAPPRECHNASTHRVTRAVPCEKPPCEEGLRSATVDCEPRPCPPSGLRAAAIILCGDTDTWSSPPIDWDDGLSPDEASLFVASVDPQQAVDIGPMHHDAYPSDSIFLTTPESMLGTYYSSPNIMCDTFKLDVERAGGPDEIRQQWGVEPWKYDAKNDLWLFLVSDGGAGTVYTYSPADEANLYIAWAEQNCDDGEYIGPAVEWH